MRSPLFEASGLHGGPTRELLGGLDGLAGGAHVLERVVEVGAKGGSGLSAELLVELQDLPPGHVHGPVDMRVVAKTSFEGREIHVLTCDFGVVERRHVEVDHLVLDLTGLPRDDSAHFARGLRSSAFGETSHRRQLLFLANGPRRADQLADGHCAAVDLHEHLVGAIASTHRIHHVLEGPVVSILKVQSVIRAASRESL